MASLSSPLLLQRTASYDIAKNEMGPGHKRFWQSDEIEKEPDAKLCLKANPKSLLFGVVLRELVPTVAILVYALRHLILSYINITDDGSFSAVYFGASRRMFDFSDTSILGFGVNVDLQLALVGFLNKVLDVFVQASLKHSASIFLTVWMALSSSKFSGVNITDFKLKDELTQPWTCVWNFWTRCSVLGWNGLGYWGLLRYITCLAVSTCVLLLALAINTVGIPKERWYPDGVTNSWTLTGNARKSMTITSPRMIINGLDWMNYWDSGDNLVGSGDSSWDAAIALAAANTYTFLGGLPDAYTQSPAGWQSIPNEIEGSITGINTIINASTVQSISVQNSRVRDIFNDLRENGPESYYKYSSGWNGLINVTAPMLTTSCVSGLAMNSSTPIGTIPVRC